MLYIGIDLGTSACKLLLTDETGDIKNIVSRSYPLDFPQPGWSEQDPAAWWQAVEEGIPALLSGYDGAQVAGIGAGGQMHGLVVLDASDRVIRPAILWNDGRTAHEVDYLNERVGRARLSDLTANIAFAGFTAPKLLWMKKNEPELFARIDKIMLPKDYINYRLTGVHCTDPSDASGMLLYDVRHGMWSAEMLGICGVRETQMPRVFPSAAAVGIPLALACRLRTAPYFLSATAVSLNLTVWLFIAVSVPLPPPPSMLMAVPYYGWLYAPWLACWLIALAMARRWDNRHAIRNSILTTLCLSVPALLVAGYFSIIISLGNALAGQ